MTEGCGESFAQAPASQALGSPLLSALHDHGTQGGSLHL